MLKLENLTASIGDVQILKGIDLEIIELSNDRPKTQHLDFRSSVLADIGYQWSSNFEEELIELIKFCEFEFGPSNAI